MARELKLILHRDCVLTSRVRLEIVARAKHSSLKLFLLNDSSFEQVFCFLYVQKALRKLFLLTTMPIAQRGTVTTYRRIFLGGRLYYLASDMSALVRQGRYRRLLVKIVVNRPDSRIRKPI